MSYTGYEEYICLNGHYWTKDAYCCYGEDHFNQSKCPICGAAIAWYNVVNTTNGSYEINPDTGEEECIDGSVELEVDVPATICTCPCGHKHVTNEATFKIPIGKGHLVK